MSKWASHKEYSQNAITNDFVTQKHGHFVAAMLPRAQLCVMNMLIETETYSIDYMVKISCVQRVGYHGY